MPSETGVSRAVRRGAAVVSLLALPTALTCGIAGLSEAALYAFAGFVIVPWSCVITHLAFTKCLTKEEKATWRRQFWSGTRAFIAVWAYMVATDLKERTRGFAPYRDSPSR